MLKKLILIFLFLIPLIGFCQYPIQTLYKGDSVLIIKLNQSRQINKKLDEQDKKIVDLENYISKINKEKKILLTDISNKDSTITYMFEVNNDIGSKLDSMVIYDKRQQEWIVETSLNNSFIYFDKTTNKIKVINFNSYKLKENKFTHSFKLKPINRKTLFKNLLPLKWKETITKVHDKLLTDLSTAIGMNTSIHIIDYPFHYKIHKKDEK